MPNYYGNMQDCSRRNTGNIGNCNNNRNAYYRNVNNYGTHSCQRDGNGHDDCRRSDDSFCEKEHRYSEDSCRCEKEHHHKCKECSVRETIKELSDMPLAMAYVPWQIFFDFISMNIR
ncbi:MAG: hypothetical protein Q4B75_00005 [Eubacteriales bacterium]|nr:hypothetical protein [Eubacteriales bacterium]